MDFFLEEHLRPELEIHCCWCPICRIEFQQLPHPTGARRRSPWSACRIFPCQAYRTFRHDLGRRLLLKLRDWIFAFRFAHSIRWISSFPYWRGAPCHLLSQGCRQPDQASQERRRVESTGHGGQSFQSTCPVSGNQESANLLYAISGPSKSKLGFAPKCSNRRCQLAPR